MQLKLLYMYVADPILQGFSYKTLAKLLFKMSILHVNKYSKIHILTFEVRVFIQ